jgi:hypothetical protein
MTDSNDTLEAAFVAGDGNTWAEAIAGEQNLPGRGETWRPAAEIDGCTFSRYEASDKGSVRSLPRDAGGKHYAARTFKATPSAADGYVRVTLRCDNPDHKPHTITMHKIVLTTFDKPCPDGMEACHSDRGPSFNWWPEGVRWGTKPENYADQVTAGTAALPEPAFPCRNAPACANMVRTRGRRCIGCVKQVGEDAAALLNAGVPLEQVAMKFGNGADWIYRLAVEYGGYEGTKTQARAEPHVPCRCLDCAPPAPRAVRPRWLLRVISLGLAGRR